MGRAGCQFGAIEFERLVAAIGRERLRGEATVGRSEDRIVFCPRQHEIAGMLARQQRAEANVDGIGDLPSHVDGGLPAPR
jgi:hypothetical protein